MTDDHSRIDELRRRVQQDPASIAFAHLAEEHRRAGDHHEAVRVCRAGLEHHPAYLSAHVTLGRALMALEQYPEARTELEFVLGAAPDHLVALKSMTELEERAGADLAPRGAGAVGIASPLDAVDPALEELQGWLAAIQADRAEREDSHPGGSAPRNPPY